VTLTEAELREEVERLRAENERLQRELGLHCKVAPKGGVSLYGLGRYPVTLYKEQWIKLLDFGDYIRQFLSDHEAELKVK
jgi:hypothetical protein